jgi:two-component system cell cycle sensor histidine kinase/response regulator CckA
MRCSDAAPAASVCILNVDDDPDSRRHKTLVLRNAGFTIREASTGPAALEGLSDGRPELVLLDVHLPGMDGFEVCERIKADPRTHDIPVLHISAARVTDEDWARGLDAGGETYLIEPVSPEVLVGTIRRVLHRRGIEQQLRRDEARILTSLRASEARYRDLFFNAPYGIYTVTTEGRVLTANRALVDMLGYESVDEVTALNASAFYDRAEDRAEMLSRWHQRGRVEGDEVRWRRRNGDPLTVRLTGRVTGESAASQNMFEVFVEDVTAQRRLEDEHRQAQKMDAVGRLATGIAHDFNNLLTAILGYTELMLDQIDADKPIHGDLVEVQRAAKSAAALTQQLLAFARKQTLRMQPLDVNVVVSATEHLIRRIIGDHIAVTVELAEGVQAIVADQVQLEQVLVNLAVNARDAMAEGGELTLATARVDLDGAHAIGGADGVKPGSYVSVTVRDTGSGMDAETLAHLFEPFFTTKGPGRGTGLGLATAYGIIKQFGGHIAVASEPDRGTTFTIYLPATSAAPVNAAAGMRQPLALGRETILVVEDEPAVLMLATTVLRRHGYRVLEAASPDAALAIPESAAIDMILTDVVMPGMQGPALVRRLHDEGRAPARAMYMSGYASEDVTAQLFDEGAVFLPKPFTQAELLAAVRRELDRPPGEPA